MSRSPRYALAPRRGHVIFTGIALVIVAGGILLILMTRGQQRAAFDPPKGTVKYSGLDRIHLQEPKPVEYRQIPPVGGPHTPVWQNCGFYPEPILSEAAVHSLEHGAVWITFRPDLPADEVSALKRLAPPGGHILVSPFPEMKSAVVASAWERQIHLSNARDPRLKQFIKAFEKGPTAPESGAACSGGFGEPEV